MRSQIHTNFIDVRTYMVDRGLDPFLVMAKLSAWLIVNRKKTVSWDEQL